MFMCTLSKKIRSKIAKIKKLVTRTPVSTKRTNRVASKNHTSGRDKKFVLSNLISRGLRGKHTAYCGMKKVEIFMFYCLGLLLQYVIFCTFSEYSTALANIFKNKLIPKCAYRKFLFQYWPSIFYLDPRLKTKWWGKYSSNVSFLGSIFLYWKLNLLAKISKTSWMVRGILSTLLANSKQTGAFTCVMVLSGFQENICWCMGYTLWLP